jgi:hypothetical protein
MGSVLVGLMGLVGPVKNTRAQWQKNTSTKRDHFTCCPVYDKERSLYWLAVMFIG